MELFQTSMQNEFDSRRKVMATEIVQLPDDVIETGTDDTLCERIASRYDFADVPTINADRIERDEAEFTQGSQRLTIKVYFPYSGDASGLFLYYTHSPMDSGSFDVQRADLARTYRLEQREVTLLQSKIDADVEFLNQHLANVQNMVPRFSAAFRRFAKEALGHRRHEFGQKRKTVASIDNLGIRIRKRDDGMEKIIVPVERKPIRIPEVREPAQNREPYYALEITVYEDILRMICSMVMVMERTPSVFARMDEEPLRTILLVGLNGLYEGQATGETFNGEGKTDILVRAQDKNVFIAECLMWRGPKYLREKMDGQLFQYAVWRDSKLALIVFNRETDFTHVIREMKHTVSSHPRCVQEMRYTHESGARYLFQREDDPQKTFVLTCLAFNVPE